MTNAQSKMIPKLHHLPLMCAEMGAKLQAERVICKYGGKKIRLKKPDNETYYKVEGGGGIMLDKDFFFK